MTFKHSLTIFLQHEDQEDTDSDPSWTDEYDNDPNYQGPMYHSQPFFCKRGVSYTPPGYVWRRVKRRKISKDTPPENVDIDDVIFGF